MATQFVLFLRKAARSRHAKDDCVKVEQKDNNEDAPNRGQDRLEF
jgi:hypothetical protein